MVTALGAIKTERPKIIAASNKEKFPGNSTGSADPKAMQVKIKANGRPEAWRVKMGRHTKGETQMHRPSNIQTAAMKLALAACWVIQADKNVRNTI